jgi:hypothetical protein
MEISKAAQGIKEKLKRLKADANVRAALLHLSGPFVLTADGLSQSLVCAGHAAGYNEGIHCCRATDAQKSAPDTQQTHESSYQRVCGRPAEAYGGEQSAHEAAGRYRAGWDRDLEPGDQAAIHGGGKGKGGDPVLRDWHQPVHGGVSWKHSSW